MKKLLLLLLFIPLVSFGQDNNTNVTVKTEKKSVYQELAEQKGLDGIHYKGNGVYESIRINGSFTKPKKLIEQAKQIAIEYAKNKKGVAKIIEEKGVRYSPGVFPKGIVVFEIVNVDGSKVISSEEAKNKLIELKEFLDLGIITQEEFDKKAVSLKKILLGN